MVTVMSQRHIIKVLVFLYTPTKRAVLLQAELPRLMLGAVLNGKTYVTIIEDGYNPFKDGHAPENH